MRPAALLLVTLCFSLSALASSHPFTNDREGKSYLISKRELRQIQALNERVTKVELQAAWGRVLEQFPADRLSSGACAFDVVTKTRAEEARFPAFRGQGELFLKSLRQHGLIDDVFLQIQLRALKVSRRVPVNLRDDFEADREVPANATLRPFLDFSSKRARGKCLHDNFRELLSAYRARNSQTTAGQVIALADDANRAGLLSDKAQAELAAAHEEKIAEWEITLADYLAKRAFLRTQFPLVRGPEQSDFSTLRAGKAKASHRMKLYQVYSSIQISLMGDVVRKLKMRLDSPRIEISVHDSSDQVVETISLDPMERFRFAIRVLRKEMRLLAINTYFGGRAPAYTDLMAAGYEMGIVTAQELDEVAKLEEIWNPRKTFLQRVGEWVRMFGGVLAIVVPQPFGFVPSLAIIGIQAVAQDNPDDTTDSLF